MISFDDIKTEIFNEGKSVYQNREVEFLGKNDDTFSFKVYEDKVYTVNIFSSALKKDNCNCKLYLLFNEPCKHIVASNMYLNDVNENKPPIRYEKPKPLFDSVEELEAVLLNLSKHFSKEYIIWRESIKIKGEVELICECARKNENGGKKKKELAYKAYREVLKMLAKNASKFEFETVLAEIMGLCIPRMCLIMNKNRNYVIDDLVEIVGEDEKVSEIVEDILEKYSNGNAR